MWKQEAQNPQNLTKFQHLEKHMSKQENTRRLTSRHNITHLKEFRHASRFVDPNF
jgi:hypothetical protein